MQTDFTRHARVEVPLICGAMYPCSNPELVAAVSEAGGLGIVQPISLIYAHDYDLREGLKKIRGLTDKPIGFNAIVEKSSKAYEGRMRAWVDIALEEGIRFFVTALGNPRWVVDEVHEHHDGIVYHNVTERRWAEKALDAGVDGLICVNERSGGHAGTESAQFLYNELHDLDVPVVCAGGIGDATSFAAAMAMGYAGVQMGTRFIATDECTAHGDYKDAIVRADEPDIVLTDKISGVPVAIIATPTIKKIGTKAGPIARRLLRHPRSKHWMRMFYTLRSVWQLKRASLQGVNYRDYFQAGRSVGGVHRVESVATVVQRFAEALPAAQTAAQ